MNLMEYFRSAKGVYILLGTAGAALMLSAFMFIYYSGGAEPEEELVLPWDETEEELSAEENNMLVPVEHIVDVKGEVKKPGIYKVNEGDRVQDVIELAGGLTENANDRAVNLAERCYDEMVIYVPGTDEGEAEYEPVSGGSSGGDEGLLINQATAEEMTVLPGIGPSKAEAILSYREENGPFTSTDDLLNVSGIGEKTLEAIADFIVIR